MKTVGNPCVVGSEDPGDRILVMSPNVAPAAHANVQPFSQPFQGDKAGNQVDCIGVVDRRDQIVRGQYEQNVPWAAVEVENHVNSLLPRWSRLDSDIIMRGHSRY